jgi:hypothetical protein
MLVIEMKLSSSSQKYRRDSIVKLTYPTMKSTSIDVMISLVMNITITNTIAHDKLRDKVTSASNILNYS